MNWKETKQQLEKHDIKNLPDEWRWRVDLRGANLVGADLVDANLRGADLVDANLRGADLRGAYLVDADLSGADLRDADLRGADLRGADLRDADLSGADLRDADLRSANLRSADLRDADLSGADLRDADLSGANLRSADLRGADLRSADLSGANLPTYQKWYVTWQIDGMVKIGCKTKTIAEWDAWFASDKTFETERNTADFERIEAAYQHTKRMIEIYQKYEAKNDQTQQHNLPCNQRSR